MQCFLVSSASIYLFILPREGRRQQFKSQLTESLVVVPGLVSSDEGLDFHNVVYLEKANGAYYISLLPDNAICPHVFVRNAVTRQHI